jgi:hypothetical protein
MASIKKLAETYSKPTSPVFRKIGDSLLLVGSTITTYAILEGDKTFAVISLICTVVGKVLTNFTTDEKVS